MNWLTIAQLTAQYGLPLAESMYLKWKSGNEPTEADFAELRGLASQNALDRAKARLVSAGITLDSPQAAEILKLLA